MVCGAEPHVGLLGIINGEGIMRNRFLALLLASLILVIIPSISQLSSASEQIHQEDDFLFRDTIASENVIQAISEERILMERKSNIAYNNIFNFIMASDDNTEYSGNYAGAYLNEAGKLVVLISTSDFTLPEQSAFYEDKSNILGFEIAIDSEAFQRKSSSFKAVALELVDVANAEDQNNIVFQDARYSYMYLTELMEQFNKSCQENSTNPKSIWSMITAFSLLDDKNCISFEILSLDTMKIERFKTEVIDSGAIQFVNSEGFAKTEATYPGEAFDTGSIGYKARRSLGNGNYEYGFVTAGHSISQNQIAYQGSSNPVGICTVSSFASSLDAAFVKTYSGYTTSRTTNHGINIVPSGYTTSAVGSTVYKEGQSASKKQGKVLSTNTSYKVAGVTYTQLLSADYISAGGDSGGIVYDSSNYVVGIHVGGPASGGDGARYVTKASRIDAVLGVYPD